MYAHTTLISCNFSSLHPQNPKIKLPYLNTSILPLPLRITNSTSKFPKFIQRGRLQICHNSLGTQKSQENSMEVDQIGGQIDGGDGGGGGGGGGQTTSFLIFLLWGGLMYYVFILAPNQTPSTDLYLVKKLCYLTGDDGFQPNHVIVSLWNIMGLWPLVYSMLLMPSGRSSKGNVPVFPFLILSFFLGAYALIPYFVLWRPPPPAVEESELKRWPLNFLDSKLTAGFSSSITTHQVTFAAGLGLIIYAGLATGDDWKEYLQYFGGSRLIHATTIDFALLSTFAPFWVYNDMTVRKWNDKGFWLLPVSLIPFLGPALYILLRPSLSAVAITPSLAASKDD
ncbi:hypothetical protein OSB04_005976 [Centaurea solstitialis]|uniref:Cardiolipin synthase N-terminal domain-containing protein n=1 Tax=Centaurea solstitialis TaxID=347529 RepID=A0AA38TSL6_9ASTR|nr:hypothetical protein OSB04_005976 [Centaurea solstitialis]